MCAVVCLGPAHAYAVVCHRRAFCCVIRKEKGLKTAAEATLNMAISKSKKSTTSDWDRCPLSHAQTHYAVQDAWIGLATIDVCPSIGRYPFLLLFFSNWALAWPPLMYARALVDIPFYPFFSKWALAWRLFETPID
jgi:hypothetical protein